ncbi:MAG TPA: putative glycoside hydrolase [Solirubrobacterales bacterium]|nr:putative glycoside hydrolase [Solirubrobacterales bacterium]
MPERPWRLVLLAGLAIVAAMALAVVTLSGDREEAEQPAAVALPGAGAPRPSASGDAAGQVRFLRDAESDFDPYLLDSTPEQRSFMRDHYWRLRGYPPTSDAALDWAPPIHFYADLYALYPGDPADRRLIEEHPQWILRDAQGRRLYVPFDCSGGTCPAYAADPGSAGWRAEWIARARAELEKGYAGVFIDNVNMVMRVGDGLGQEVAPLDPRTGEAMTLADWQGYVAAFVREIRDAFPRAEIVHNVIWFAKRSPAVRSEIEAADYVELERGFSDTGIADRQAYSSLLDYVDWVHSLGSSMILEPYDLDDQRRLFELASYFLINEGGDAIASDFEADPGSWWPGWETDLGSPQSPRGRVGGILRRDFERGIVLVNPPGAPQQSFSLPEGYVDLDGAPVETITLGPAQGAILLGAA